MKSKLLLISTFILLYSTIVHAQAPYWKLGGNPNVGPDFVTLGNNFLGTTIGNNIPLRIGTQAKQRLFIAETNANGVPNSLGNVGIGSLFFGGGGGISPFSNLHIQQDNSNLFGFGGGFRPWMSTAGTSTGNSTNGWNRAGTGIMISNGDNIWLGLKNKGGYDLNDAILNWGDNGGNGGIGTDYFRFVFTHYGNNFLGSTTDGIEIMRMAPNTKVGIGDFNVTNQIQPRSKLHIHENGADHNSPSYGDSSVWFQMTNRDFAPAPSWSDGLRIGILYQQAANRTANAFIYNQENRHLIFSTNHVTPDGPGSIFNTKERMRLTSIGAPTVLPTGGYGVYNPGLIANTDLTRLAISHNPLSPIQRPLSLLHLGYDPLGSFGNPTVGWRPWMDVGMFISSRTGASTNTDNMYFGLKAEGTDRLDAVINWGNDVITNPFLGNGPDNLRFIFTGVQNTANGVNGLEGIRLTPSDSGRHVYTGIGGDPTNNPYYLGAINPTLTLEVNSPALGDSAIYSGMRFTDMTAAVTPLTNPGKGVLGLDSTGRVIYVKAGSDFGNICGDTILNPLLNNWEIPMNQHNYVFSGQDASTDRVGVGTACLPAAKFEVLNTTTFPGFITRASKISALGTAGINMGMDLQSSKGLRNIGIIMRVDSSSLTSNTVPNSTAGILLGMAGNRNRVLGIGMTIQASNVAVGGQFQVTSTNKAVTGLNLYTAISSTTVGINNVGLNVSTQGVASHNYSILATSGNGIMPTYATISNIGVYGNTGLYSGIPAAPGSYRYSFYADALAPTGTITTTNTDYAGFFNGGVYTAQIIYPSDELMKKDMVVIPDALAKIKQLEAISYTFDQTLASDKGMSLPANLQYGFKAQQVASLFPDLVSGIHKPEMKDTLDNVVKPAYDFQGVNYIGFISVLTRGIQQQQTIIDSLTTTSHNKDSIQDAHMAHQDSIIQQLMNMINNCCQSQGGRTNMNNTNSTIAQTNVDLSDKDIVVLNQNVPNPFAEQTSITYSIPEKSGYAQILFNDMKGQVIKVVDIKTKGRGQLNVFANDLSSGMYSYSLYVDGKLIDTKKMVKTE